MFQNFVFTHMFNQKIVNVLFFYKFCQFFPNFCNHLIPIKLIQIKIGIPNLFSLKYDFLFLCEIKAPTRIVKKHVWWIPCCLISITDPRFVVVIFSERQKVNSSRLFTQICRLPFLIKLNFIDLLSISSQNVPFLI